MEEQNQNEKKAWLTPVIEELDIKGTMGGPFHWPIEHVDYHPLS